MLQKFINFHAIRSWNFRIFAMRWWPRFFCATLYMFITWRQASCIRATVSSSCNCYLFNEHYCVLLIKLSRFHDNGHHLPSFSHHTQMITSKPEPEMNSIVWADNDVRSSLGQQSPGGVATYWCHAQSSDQIVAIGGQWVDTMRVARRLGLSVLFLLRIFIARQQTSRFSTNKSLYLANDTRYRYSYYGRQIGMRSIKRCHFQWPLTNFNPVFKVIQLWR